MDKIMLVCCVGMGFTQINTWNSRQKNVSQVIRWWENPVVNNDVKKYIHIYVQSN